MLTEDEENMIRGKMIDELSEEIYIQSKGRIVKPTNRLLAEKHVGELDLYNANQMRKSMGARAQIIVDAYLQDGD